MKYTTEEVIEFVTAWEDSRGITWEFHTSRYPKEMAKVYMEILEEESSDPFKQLTWDKMRELMVRELVTNRTKLGRALK